MYAILSMTKTNYFGLSLSNKPEHLKNPSDKRIVHLLKSTHSSVFGALTQQRVGSRSCVAARRSQKLGLM
jgi:hypothetical protein